jgi:tetratricopeptide (TPR) repeat protein
MNLGTLGWVAADQGDYASAREMHEQALLISRETGNRDTEAKDLYSLGSVEKEQGNYSTARSFFEQALAIRVELGNTRFIAYSLRSFASLSAVQGLPERAARLWGAEEALRAAIGAPLAPREREKFDLEVYTVRVALGEAAFAVAWTKGQMMTLEQVIAYALNET